MEDAFEQTEGEFGVEDCIMSSSTEFNKAPNGVRPSPQSTDKFDRLKELLRAMFQLDRGDLDFGLYRIMNLKAAEIEAFLENDLLPQVKTVLASMADDERAALYVALAEARQTSAVEARPRLQGRGIAPEVIDSAGAPARWRRVRGCRTAWRRPRFPRETDRRQPRRRPRSWCALCRKW